MHPTGDDRARTTLGVARVGGAPPPEAYHYLVSGGPGVQGSRGASQEGARAGQAGTMFALWRKRLSGSQVRLISRSLVNRSGPNAAATRAAVWSTSG